MKLQTGKITGRHAVIVGVLLVALYFVFPSSPSANSTPKSDTVPNGSQSAEASPTAASPGAATGSNQPPQRPDMPVQELNLIVERLPAVSDEELQKMISASPFFTAAAVVSEPENAVTDVDVAMPAIPAPAPAGSAPIEQLAADANLNLLYSSSKGTKAAVINNEIVHPGATTKNGLTVDTIRIDGLDVSLSTK